MAPGAYAEQLIVEQSLTFPVPNGLAPEIAALTEPMAIGWHPVRRGEVRSKFPHPRYSKVIVYSSIMTENQPETSGSDESGRLLKHLGAQAHSQLLGIIGIHGSVIRW
jgi:hypothetical protein